MSTTMQIELDANAADEIRDIAAVLHKTPEETAEQMVSNGLHMLRRYAFYIRNAGTVTPQEGLEILSRAGKGNPPDPGDEIPDDLKVLLEQRGR